MLIVFSGHDGSGKSFLCNSITQLYTPKQKIFVYEFRKYFFINNFVERVRKLLLKDNTKLLQSNPYLHKGIKPFYYNLWPLFIYILDWVYFLLVIKPKSINHIVICDRFFTDRLIGFYYYGYLKSNLFDVLVRFTPKPKYTFILYCEAELAKSRETDDSHELAFYSEMKALYIKLSDKYKLTSIDTTSEEEVITKVKTKLSYV